MMKKTFALLLALVMALALVACGQKDDNIGGETKDDQTQTDGQSVDLRAAYEAGIKQVQEELGDNAPVLLEETAVEILNSYYPGLENAKLKQSVFFISPTATSCEVSMVEAESAADAEIVRQSFQARVDAMADAAKQAKIMAAEAEAESILKVQQAMADSMRMLNENAPNDQVIKLKALEALEKVADGKATKLIIPSEIQGLAGLAASAKMLVENDAPAAE